MFDIDITKDSPSGIHVLTLSGECMFAEKASASEYFTQILEESPKRVIIDLSKCSILDSSGIGMLAAYHMKLREKQSGARIAVVTGRNNYLIRKLSQLGIFKGMGIEVFKTFNEAKAALEKEHF